MHNFGKYHEWPIRVCPFFVHKPLWWFRVVSVVLPLPWQILPLVPHKKWQPVDGSLPWWYNIKNDLSISYDESKRRDKE